MSAAPIRACSCPASQRVAPSAEITNPRSSPAPPETPVRDTDEPAGWRPSCRPYRFRCSGIAVRNRRVPIGSSATGTLSRGRWTELFRAMPVTGRRPRRWRWRAGPDCHGPLLARGGAGIEGRAPRPAGAPRRPDHQPSKGAGAVHPGAVTVATARLVFAGGPHQPATGTGPGRAGQIGGPAGPLPAMASDPGWDEHRGAASARPALGARTTRAVMSRSSACCSRRRIAACPARVPGRGRPVSPVR